MMRPRKDLIELFSTFVQFEADGYRQFVWDARLRRSMLTYLGESSKSLEWQHRWALYWHKQWQQSVVKLAAMHLLAYLQEPCYWAAYEIHKKYPSPQYSESDCFQIAIAHTDSILKTFNPERGSSLVGYAKLTFASRIRDVLRQWKITEGVTTWTLLRRVGKKDFVAALQRGGLSASEIAHYQLARTCFKALYIPGQPGSQGLPDPDHALWDAVAALYNSERASQLPPATPPGTPEILEKWLKKAATHVRAYKSLPTTSLTRPDNDAELDLPTPGSESPLAALISDEEMQGRLAQQQRVYTVLTETLAQLPADQQATLQLYYQQHQTQQQIADQLGISQPTVVRRLNRARDALLNALLKETLGSVAIPEDIADLANTAKATAKTAKTTKATDAMNNSPTPALIKERGAALEEWLQIRYANHSATRGHQPT